MWLLVACGITIVMNVAMPEVKPELSPFPSLEVCEAAKKGAEQEGKHGFACVSPEKPETVAKVWCNCADTYKYMMMAHEMGYGQ